MTSQRNNVKKMMFLWVWVMVAYAIFTCVALLLIKNEVSIDQKNQWNWGWIIMSIEFLHFSLSFRTIGPKDLGAILFFGRPLYQVKSGLVYVPFIVCQLTKETGLVIKEQFPGEPEFVDKSGDDSKPVAPGFVKPLRVSTASKEMLDPEQKKRIEGYIDDPLNEIMVLEPSVIVRFQIQKDNFISFLVNIGSIKHAISQMMDTVASVLNIEFPKRTPALIILDKEEINKKLKESIEILVGEIPNPKDPDSFNSGESWGINVINVQIADIDLSKKIHQSLRDVADSKLRKKITITDATARKESRELDGKGENAFETEKGSGVANAKLSSLKAEALGLFDIVKIAKTEEGKLVIVTKATEQGLKGSQYSIIPDGVGSIITGIMEIMKKIKSREQLPDDTDKTNKKETVAGNTPKEGGTK